MKLTEQEKQKRKLMRMFEKHFRNYNLNFEKSQATEDYLSGDVNLMFSAYTAGYNKRGQS